MWQSAYLKYVSRFVYGDALPQTEEEHEGIIKVFGSNGPYATYFHANTKAPAIIIGRKGSYGKINWSEEPCFASDTTFFVDSSTTNHNLRWLFYVLQTLHIDKGSNEVAVPGLNRDDAYNRIISVPPLATQHAIATYLDRETAKIDAMIDAKQRLLTLLAEKRRALITHAVTRGLDPTAPLRDSSVPWIGAVPAHWRVEGFTRFLNSLVDYRGKTPEKTETGIFLITARNIRNGYIDYSISQEYVAIEEYDNVMARGKPKIGDILFTMEAPLGQVALIDRENVALAQRVIKLDYDTSFLHNKFAMYWFISAAFQWHLNSLSTGSTAIGIKASKLSELWNIIPTIEEQIEIIDYIEREEKKLITLRDIIIKSINLLHERRVTLIAAAVTGQITVTG